MKNLTLAQVYENHLNAGYFVLVDGIQTFVLDIKPDGAATKEPETVFCLHGVPTSSFLYRKLLSELGRKGLRAICIDLPGLGLSDRPENFEYTFSAFAHFCAKAVQELGLKKYHLVVHDVGGPIGFALAARHPEQIASLTILNTWIDVVNFKKPLPMRPFEVPVLQNIQLAAMTNSSWQLLFKTLGVSSAEGIPKEEINIYVDLLKRGDGGRAFLKIMRRFEDSEEFRTLCYRAVQDVPYPVQAIWGAEDPALNYERYGTEIKRVAMLEHVHELPAKHLLQEEQAPELARLISKQVQDAGVHV